MKKLNSRKNNFMIKRIAAGVLLSCVVAMGIFAVFADELFYNFLAGEVLPFYVKAGEKADLFFKYEDKSEKGEENLFFIPSEEAEISQESQREIAQAVEVISSNIIGIKDVVYQDEPEFGDLPDISYKENFTADNLHMLADKEYFLSSFYNKDKSTGINYGIFDAEKFFAANLSANKSGTGPKVLIFHTHGATEYFIDSDTSDIYEGIIGAGAELKNVFEQKYGIKTLHCTEIFDMVDGKGYRDGSYERMEPVIQKILDENPTIEVVIDLHRDGIEQNPNLVVEFDGKPYAKLMFVNGVTALNENGVVKEITSLPNKNLAENLAFSFNMQIAANEIYPGLTRKIYLKPYRFSTHMKAKSLLVEIGSQYNTKEEAFNSMELLADLVESVVFADLD